MDKSKVHIRSEMSVDEVLHMACSVIMRIKHGEIDSGERIKMRLHHVKDALSGYRVRTGEWKE